jgi:hypothetical protein
MTIAERLLAGEHIGCASWADACKKMSVSPKALYIARMALKARGRPVDLRPAYAEPTGYAVDGNNLGAVFGDATLTNLNEPTYSNLSMKNGGETSDFHGSKWGNVEQFDREQQMVTVAESTLYDADGNVKLTWVKSKVENDERRDWLQAIRDMAPLLPVEPVEPSALTDNDLLVVLPVGDPHVGLLSWHEDAGENFDLKIAERNLVGAFHNLVGRAPAAGEALLVFIGDNTHADGQHNTTTKGTRVDVDGRTVKMARTIIDVIRQAVALSLAKFGKVTVIVERGNHDELLSAMIALALALHYEQEPRVTIDQSPEMYHWYRFGSVLIGTHHGDKAKPEQLLGVMAVDRQKDWGETTHRRFYCGHYHHQIVKELPGLIVEYLPTLASSDAWHRAMGYRSSRAMYMDVFHREWGHVDRAIVGISMLRAGR